MVSDPSAPDPLAAIAKARGTARLIVTTTPGLTMTVLAQEELVDAIAAALAREAATQRQAADHWFTEANREHNARVRVEGERDDAERELAGVRVTFTAMEELRMQTRDALVRQSARIAALEAALEAIERHIPPDLLDQFGVLALLRKALAPPERSR